MNMPPTDRGELNQVAAEMRQIHDLLIRMRPTGWDQDQGVPYRFVQAWADRIEVITGRIGAVTSMEVLKIEVQEELERHRQCQPEDYVYPAEAKSAQIIGFHHALHWVLRLINGS